MPALWKDLSKIDDYPAYLEQAWQEHLQPKADNAPTVISTFAGCGGSSLGYSMAGFRELLAIEWDDNAVETFKLNFDVPVIKGDIAKVTVEEVLKITGLQAGELDVFDGSPPCQGFSTAGKREMTDSRNQLFREYVRLLRGLKPKVFVMENVSGMVKGKMKIIFAEILRELKASGYKVSARLLNAMYFGVPQARQRMIFIGVREDLGIEPSHPVAEMAPVASSNAIAEFEFYGGPDLTPVSEKYYPMLAYGESASKYHPKGHLFGMIKLDPHQPSPTLLKSCGNPVCHYSQPRFLSAEELKSIASFPKGFITIGSIGLIRDRIGNSVPPLFMRSIARHIRAEILDLLH